MVSFSPFRLPLYLVSFVVSLLFLLVNLTCAILVRIENSERKIIVLIRVAINDSLFVLCAISLSICLYKISKMSLANIYLESKVKYNFRHLYNFWGNCIFVRKSEWCMLKNKAPYI